MPRTSRIAALLAVVLTLAAGACRQTPRCRQLCQPTQPTTLALVAGHPGGSGHVDGPLASAHFRDPWQLACDGAGHVYLTEDGANHIRAIDLKTGTVSTLAGSPNLVGSRDGVGAEATFHGPSGLALRDGKLYVADVEHHLLRVVDVATRRVTTLGGKVNVLGWKDGPLAAAIFNEPEGLSFDGDSLYLGDTDNNAIRKIDVRTGMVSTVVGALERGSADGPRAQARFYKPMSVAADGNGRLYVADTLNDAVRTVLLKDGSVTTLARFPATPLGLAVVGPDLIVGLADHRVARIDRTSGAVTTWLGAVGQEGFVDASAGGDARFSRPAGACSDGAGNLVIADSGNHALRIVSLQTGAVRTLAAPRSSGAEDGSAEVARFSAPLGLASDPTGGYFVADTGNSTIRRVGPDGRVSTIAGSPGAAGAADGNGATARFRRPEGLALDGHGALFVADSDNRLLRRIDVAGGAVTTLAPAIEGGHRLVEPTGLAFVDGTLFVADHGAQVVFRIDPASQRGTVVAGKPNTPGIIDGPADKARFNGPQSLAADGLGNLYVADVGSGAIRKIALATRVVSTVAGARVVAGFGKDPPFNYPTHVVANGLGELFVADSNNNVVRRVDVGSGRVTTLVGSWSDSGVRLGPLPAQLDHPAALALAADGSLALVAENAILVAR